MTEEPTDESADSADRTEESSEQPEKRKPRKLADSFKTGGVFANLYSASASKIGKAISDEIVGKFTRQITSAFKPKIPPPSSYVVNFKYKSPLDDIVRQWNQALRAQWEPAFEALRKAVRAIYPDNWGDAHPPSVDVLESILVDEGIPLASVPGPKVVEAIFEAADAAERRRVIGRRWKGIAADCEAVLDSVTYPHLLDERDFALDCVRALRDGHTNAAQALAANLLDSVLRKYFDEQSRQKVTSNNFKRDGVKFDLDDHIFRVSLTFAPVWCAHIKYRTEHGDPIPSTYGRHPSAHAVCRRQYKQVNAVLAVMVVTSVIKFFDVELARRDARADK